MSTNATEPPRQSADWADDEIDLRQYIDVLVRWWKEIALITLLTVVVTVVGILGLRFLSKPTYEAGADVAILRTVSELTFDERFTTTSDNATVSNSAARRNALVALAVSPSLAAAVVDQLGDVLTTEEQEPGTLVKMIDAELMSAGGRAGDSDLIRITAAAESPEKAAQIATAWAQAYVREVNQVYGQVPDELLQSIQTEQAQAKTEYEAAQNVLEQFVATSRVDELSRQIANSEAIISSLQQGKLQALGTLIAETVEARRKLASTYLDAQAQNVAAPYAREQEGRREFLLAQIDALYGAQTEVFHQQVERDTQLLQGYYTRWLQVTRALDEARTLRTQVADSGENASGGSALVAQVLKLQALTQMTDPPPTPQVNIRNNVQLPPSSQQQPAQQVIETSQPLQVGNTPLQIQLNADAVFTRDELLTDIDALVSVLATRRSELEQQIATLSEQMLGGDQYANLNQTVQPGSALAQAITAQQASISGQTALTQTQLVGALGSASALPGAPVAELFQTDELRALAEAQSQDDALSGTMTELEADVRSLKADLETERARQLQLTQQRDLSWEAYRTLSSKVAELALTRAAAGSEVRFAAPGVAPADPMAGVSLSLAVALAGVVGLMIGVFVAFISNYLGKEPFLSRRTVASLR
jgi:uncharacterized protein involved in exopolysaccharide biosynthesis